MGFIAQSYTTRHVSLVSVSRTAAISVGIREKISAHAHWLCRHHHVAEMWLWWVLAIKRSPQKYQDHTIGMKNVAQYLLPFNWSNGLSKKLHDSVNCHRLALNRPAALRSALSFVHPRVNRPTLYWWTEYHNSQQDNHERRRTVCGKKWKSNTVYICVVTSAHTNHILLFSIWIWWHYVCTQISDMCKHKYTWHSYGRFLVVLLTGNVLDRIRCFPSRPCLLFLAFCCLFVRIKQGKRRILI